MSLTKGYDYGSDKYDALLLNYGQKSISWDGNMTTTSGAPDFSIQPINNRQVALLYKGFEFLRLALDRYDRASISIPQDYPSGLPTATAATAALEVIVNEHLQKTAPTIPEEQLLEIADENFAEDSTYTKADIVEFAKALGYHVSTR